MWFRIAALCTLVAFGCTTAVKPTRGMGALTSAQISESQVRHLSRYVARQFTGHVQRAADEILDRTDDAEIEKHALLWKTNAVNAAHTAVIRVDSIVALIDLWVLAMQTERFVTDGAGAHLFGDLQAIAVDATKRAAIFAGDAVQEALGPAVDEEARSTVRRWATEHPIRDLGYTREFPREAMMMVDEGAWQGSLSAVYSIEEQVVVFGEFAPLLISMLPKQFRWQGQILLNELLSQPQMVGIMRDLRHMSKTLKAIQHALDTLPDAAAEQRDNVLSRLPDVASDSAEVTEPRLRGLIDHLVWRLVQMLAVFAVVVGSALWWFTRRRPAHRS